MKINVLNSFGIYIELKQKKMYMGQEETVWARTGPTLEETLFECICVTNLPQFDADALIFHIY